MTSTNESARNPLTSSFSLLLTCLPLCLFIVVYTLILDLFSGSLFISHWTEQSNESKRGIQPHRLAAIPLFGLFSPHAILPANCPSSYISHPSATLDPTDHNHGHRRPRLGHPRREALHSRCRAKRLDLPALYRRRSSRNLIPASAPERGLRMATPRIRQFRLGARASDVTHGL